MSQREDHRHLASLLSKYDPAFATDIDTTVENGAFEFDGSNDPDDVFPQSVASGGPTPTGVILWTRISPDAYNGDPLGVEVAHDPDFDDTVLRGVVDDEAVLQAHDYTVKIDLDGSLEDDSVYYYRFVYSDTASRVGRCRTLPAYDSNPESVSFAVLTCQNYLNGYYGAFRHVAREDVDFIIHVGDFIYESSEGEFMGVGSPSFEDRELELPSGEERVQGLGDYRYLYRKYKTDPYLQEALERHTMIPARDDHEIANDVYWDYDDDGPKADHPRGDDTEFMSRLTADAIHAWWEYMPARIRYNPEAERLHERFQLWRTLEFGDLIDLIMTDERLFRDGPRDGPALRSNVLPENESGRTMLGDDQLEWFLDTLKDSDATWTVWSDEVLIAPLKLGVGPVSLYPVQVGWDGFTEERQKVFETIDEHVTNFVTLTGDMHCYVASYLPADHEAVDANGESNVGVEFMTPAVTSFNVAEALGLNKGPLAWLTERPVSWLVETNNPHIEFFNSHHNGYSVVEFTRDDCTYTAYRVDKKADPEDAPKEVMTSLRVPEGRVEIHDATDV